MASNTESETHADGDAENSSEMNEDPDRRPDGLELPLLMVHFEMDDDGNDHFVVGVCPWCGLDHRHSVSDHLTVALGGLSKARCSCRPSDHFDEREACYYLVLRHDGTNLPYDVVHYARNQLTNMPGDKLWRPLVPKGVDPRVIEDTLDYWHTER